jgi:hypothetical protein
MFPLTLAMGASIAWGASDFLGGMVSRRLPVTVVLLGAQLVGLLLGAALCFGAFFVFLGDASEQAGVAAVVCGRVVSVGLLALLRVARPSSARISASAGA